MVLGTLVIESTGSYLARDAFAALELAEQLFEKTFRQSRSPSIMVSICSFRISMLVILSSTYKASASETPQAMSRCDGGISFQPSFAQ